MRSITDNNVWKFLLQGLDAGTSDDSGRASEQLHGPGIPRDCQDADSSRDHLSDVISYTIIQLKSYNLEFIYDK